MESDWGTEVGQDAYTNTLSQTLLGQPQATSVNTGKAIVSNGTQF